MATSAYRIESMFGALARWSAGRRLLDARAVPIYGVLAVAGLVVLAAIAGGWFDYDPIFVTGAASAVGSFLVIAYAARWIGFPGLATALEMTMLVVATAVLIAFCSAIFASSALPYRDDWLAWIDSWMFGFDRRAVVAWTALHAPGVMRAATWIYNSLAVTPALLLALLLVTGRERDAWVVMTAMTLTVAVSVCVLPLVPALGTPPYAYRFVEVFEGVRDGSLRRLDGGIITGLVTFPSVHAADGIILAWGFARLGRWALPLVAINLLMVGAALLMGGHYLIDLIAGTGVALATLYAAAAMVDRFDDSQASTRSALLSAPASRAARR